MKADDMRTTLLSLIALAALMSPAVAGPADEADAHFSRGVALSEEGSYDAAAEAFAAAYELAPKHEYLYAWAQAERLRGDCERAAALYVKFLAVEPPEGHAELARVGLARCPAATRAVAGRERSVLLDGSTRAPVAASPREAPPAVVVHVALRDEPEASTPRALAPPSAERAPDRQPWYVDGWGAALTFSGAIGLGASAAWYASSLVDAESADKAPTYGRYAELADQARDKQRLGLVSGAIGVTLVLGGVIRYAGVRGRDRGLRPVAAVRADGIGIGLAGGF